tara:strand:- start:572 stop:727 length:156 start_codon:yes stop_codon:yes gene_type:complete
MKERITPSPHDPYELGYRCATMGITKRSDNVSWSKSIKFSVIWIVLCNSRT